MRLVLDANVVISLLINPSAASIDLFFRDDLDLYIPEIIFEEIDRNMNDIAARSTFSKEETLKSSFKEVAPINSRAVLS